MGRLSKCETRAPEMWCHCPVHTAHLGPPICPNSSSPPANRGHEAAFLPPVSAWYQLLGSGDSPLQHRAPQAPTTLQRAMMANPRHPSSNPGAIPGRMQTCLLRHGNAVSTLFIAGFPLFLPVSIWLSLGCLKRASSTL